MIILSDAIMEGVVEVNDWIKAQAAPLFFKAVPKRRIDRWLYKFRRFKFIEKRIQWAYVLFPPDHINCRCVILPKENT